MLPPLPEKLETENGREGDAATSPIPSPAPSIFLPIIDNGQGSIKANFMVCCVAAFAGYDVYMERYSDSLTPRARNRAAAKFLRGDRDYLLFIDCDIVFSKEHIDLVMQSDEPVVAGIYCKKEKEVAPCINMLELNSTAPVGGLIEIARAGTGFIRIHRSVLEAMKERDNYRETCLTRRRNMVTEILSRIGMNSIDSIVELIDKEISDQWLNAALYNNHGEQEWDFFSTGVKNREYLSEDWFFCDRARALGFKVLLDTRIQTKHEGTAFYPTDEAIERQAEKEKAMTLSK